MGKAKFQIYEDKAGEYRWRLKAGNGEEIAASEGYTTKQSAHRSAQGVKDTAPGADIEDA
jgi:hypothetical protein